MILKGNIRAGGQELANHLLNDRDNDRVELADINGFASQDLHDAFAETAAIATGTNCKKYLYSLSINPDQELTREQYQQAIDKISDKLGLSDQPKAVVFHIKNGREHCHVAWSRIDTDKMQAVAMPFDRQRLREVARELVLDFGHKMPKHLAEDRGADRFNDVAKDQTLAEKGQAERSGITPEERRDAITKAYNMADTSTAFRHALFEEGYFLAKGDKRGLVVVDRAGDVHALTRQIQGVKAKEIRDKLTFADAGDLPTVQQAKDEIANIARQRADIATQERPDSPDRIEQAMDGLSALTDAHRADLKALRGSKAHDLKSLREEQADQLDNARQAIKEAYKPEWADLYKQQRDEVEAVKAELKSPMGRLKALLEGRAGDAFDFENRNTLAGAFKFVVRGEINLDKLEKAHKAERVDLGDRQKLAERTELSAIKEDIAGRRAEVQRDHAERLAESKSRYAEEMQTGLDELETARKLSERDGTDLSQGEVHDRATSSHSDRAERTPSAKEGFGHWGVSFGNDLEDDDDERPLKPPGQSFTP